jgi:hypothetical protein
MQMCTINWGSVADWVSGIGALSAALVALYLARRSERIRLRAYCGFRLIVGAGIPKSEVLCVSATNVGTRTTIVNNIGMRVGRFKRRYALISMMPTAISAGIPQQLVDGQSVSWHIPLDSERTWVKDLCKTFVRSRSDARSLRFTIHTNHGLDITIVPEKPLIEAIEKLLSESGS